MNALTKMTMPLSSNEQASANPIDLPALWSIFKRRFRLFVAAAMVTLAIVMIVTFQLTPIFEAQSRVVLNARETQALDVSAIISGISPDAATVDTEVQIIRSRSLARKVATDLNLFAVPEFNPAVDENNGWLSRLLPGQLRTDDEVDPETQANRVINRLIEAVDVERAGITYAINIRARSEDPALAAAIANSFAERYVLDSVDQKLELLDLVGGHLSDAVEEHREKLRIAEQAVELYREESGLLSAEGSLLSEQQISDIQAQLIVQEAELAERRAKLTTVNRRVALGAGAEAISDVLASPLIGELRADQADLARRRADLEARYGPLHPSLENLASEEKDLQNQIQAEIDRIVVRLENDVDVASQRVQSLRASISELRSSMSSDNQALVRLRELEREAEVSRRNYEQLLERSQQAVLFEDLAEADARVADDAAKPLQPSFPNKKLNLVLGLVLGSALGGLVVVLAEVFDNGLRTGTDIERSLDTNLIALVPQLDNTKMSGDINTPEDYVIDKPLSALAESYRTLRSAITLGRDSSVGGRIVALTSAISGEGKTSSALCLGRIAALAGDKVLVIDCDVRRRALSARMMPKEAEDVGLAEVLRGSAKLSAALVKDEKSDLRVLPVSEDRSGIGDLFGSARFESLLSQFRAKFDLIILDTAPLTAVADTRAVVAAADNVVQFVKWKDTPVNLARNANKILVDLEADIVGAVLTQVNMRAQAGYGYEGSYRYYAQHGKYYYD